MDYCFKRSDTGYDAIVLAMQYNEDKYQVYLLGDDASQEKWLFDEEDSNRLKQRIIEWCASHLPEELTMESLPVKRGQLSYSRVKSFLHEHNVPYEMHQRTFYVRKRDYNLYKHDLDELFR